MDRRCGPGSRGYMVGSQIAALILLAIVLLALVPPDAQALSPPAAPTNLKATPGDAQVSLSWSEPKAAGQYRIDYYVIYRDGADIKHSVETSTVIAGLTNGRTYSFAVAAHNSAGVGERSSVVRSTPLGTSTVPGPPTGLRATAGDTVVSLSWAAPASDGGETIDHYTVYRNGVAIMDVTTNEATISGLTNGRSYEFEVAAHNSAGTGRASAPVASTPSATLPPTAPFPSGGLEAPIGLRATPGDGAVTLSWNAPGGGAIDYYIIYQDGVDLMHVAGTSATIAGLSNDREYSFAVSAHGPDGVGPASAPITALPKTAAVGDADNIALMIGMLFPIGTAGAVALLLMNRTRARRPD